ncbi:PqqD family protein [Flexivirga sp. ID2601S]|uniref:PqqD family protein n=1 Tax=Flexivirga aerilata TaxID=1656889 RepID=A0A849AR80_9MICO|nr:PqqD family protein [Flexivirga aerilata]
MPESVTVEPSVSVRRAPDTIALPSVEADHLLLLGTGEVPIVLRDSALAIWGLTETPTTPRDIALQVSELYTIDATEAIAQVSGFLAELIGHGLLVVDRPFQSGATS